MFSFSRIKRGLLKVGALTTVVAAAQGIAIRMKYEAINPPPGPFFGSESWIGNVKEEIKTITKKNWAKLTGNTPLNSQLPKQIEDHGSISITSSENKTSLKPQCLPAASKRSIKLILVGDSLVCGVGSEELILPRVIAKSLSMALQADVVWKAQGLNGAFTLFYK